MVRKRLHAPQNTPISGGALGSSALSLKRLAGIAAPVSNRSENVTLRLAGVWLELWESLKQANPTLTDSELLRQALALRAALSAVDEAGNRPRALIEYVNEKGEKVVADLEEHVGIKQPSATP
jgi:hypothetical protein